MNVLLRWIGIVNVAIWFGAVVFFTVGVYPAFSSAEMKSILGEQSYPAFSGRLGMVVAGRYFLLHYWCGSIALLHALAERFYLGKPLQRFNFALLVGLCSLSLIGGGWVQPSLKRLHAIEYGRPDYSSPAQKALAARASGTWRGVAVAMNLLVLCGLTVYLWRVTNPGNGTRFVPATKFRG